jgi:hypothetical protein
MACQLPELCRALEPSFREHTLVRLDGCIPNVAVFIGNCFFSASRLVLMLLLVH